MIIIGCDKLKKKSIFLITILILTILVGCNLNKEKIDSQAPKEEQIKKDEVSAEGTDPNEDIEKNEQREKFLAPDFILKNLAGEEVSLSDFQGKYVLLNFWATWCVYCDMEMPSLNKLYKENDDLVVLAVDVMEDKKTVEKYIEKGKYEFPVVLDEEGEVSREYYVGAFPTSYFVDKEGYLIYRAAAMLEYEQMVEIMEDLRNQ